MVVLKNVILGSLFLMTRFIFEQATIDRLNEIKRQGFNLYTLINMFYRRTKLRLNIPDAVVMRVCDSFEKYKPKEPFPYFMRVLKAESEQHFAALQGKHDDPEEINEEGLKKMKELLSSINMEGNV